MQENTMLRTEGSQLLRMPSSLNKEIKRQLFHMLVGIAALAVLFAFGRGVLMGAVFFILLAGLVLINQAYLGRKTGLVEWFIRNFEREGIRFPGWGSACYATGVLLLSSFLNDPAAIAASLVIVAVGDGLSTIAGLFGKLKLPYNNGKTVEGSLVFFISSLAGYFFIGPLILPAAFLAALVESLPLPVDDNITIPVALVLFFFAFGVA